MNGTLHDLQQAIISADTAKVDQLLDNMNNTFDYDQIHHECIEPALNILCANIQDRKGAIPELLMGLKQVHRIAGVTGYSGTAKRPQKILMGVIEGDIHDMGKNVIRDVCTGYGYEVTDLGKNVSSAAFAEAAKVHQADVACLSTMMSTTIEAMEKTITQLRACKPGIRILIGGAFMNQEMAGRLAADGYAKNASTVMNEIERILQ
jgi:5-methyltetrahydrofolate--homocysteine methyltransferase